MAILFFLTILGESLHVVTPHENSFQRISLRDWAWQSLRVDGIENSTDRLGEKFRKFIRDIIVDVDKWERNGRFVEHYSFNDIVVIDDRPIIQNVGDHYDPNFYKNFKQLVRRVLGIEDQDLLPELHGIKLDTNVELKRFFEIVDFFESQRIPFRFLEDHPLLLSSYERYHLPVKVVDLFRTKYGFSQGWMNKFIKAFPEEIYPLERIVSGTPFSSVFEHGTYIGRRRPQWVNLWTVLRFARNATDHVNQHLHGCDSLHEQQIERQLKKFFPNLLLDVYEFLIHNGIDLDLLENVGPSRSSSNEMQSQQATALQPDGHYSVPMNVSGYYSNLQPTMPSVSAPQSGYSGHHFIPMNVPGHYVDLQQTMPPISAPQPSDSGHYIVPMNVPGHYNYLQQTMPSVPASEPGYSGHYSVPMNVPGHYFDLQQTMPPISAPQPSDSGHCIVPMNVPGHYNYLQQTMPSVPGSEPGYSGHYSIPMNVPGHYNYLQRTMPSVSTHASHMHFPGVPPQPVVHNRRPVGPMATTAAPHAHAGAHQDRLNRSNRRQ